MEERGRESGGERDRAAECKGREERRGLSGSQRGIDMQGTGESGDLHFI